MKRILVIINGWTTRIAGGDYHMLRVAQQWSEKNEITYLIPRLGYNFAKEAIRGKAVVFDSGVEYETSNPLAVAAIYFARVLKLWLSPPKLNSYDTVIASSHFLVDVLPTLLFGSKNRSCKRVVYWHGLPVTRSSPSWYLLRKLNDSLAASLLRRHFDLVFVTNRAILDLLVSLGVSVQTIQITNNGTDPERRGADSKKPIFDACYVGRLVKTKGVFDLVAIWKSIAAEIPAAKLAIVGDGPEKDRLAEQINRQNLNDRISLCGFVEEDKKFEIMLHSRLFLFPSYADDWGIAILDAMSCGLPVIVYDSPALRSVWGNDVTYVPAGDKESFRRAVLRVLNDSDLRSELSRRGLYRSAEYSWTRVADDEAAAIQNA